MSGRPTEWFLVWANDREAALSLVREEIDEPDLESVRRVEGEGYFLFRASAVTNDVGLVELDPPPGEVMIIRDPPAEEWILRRLAEQGQVRPARARHRIQRED